MVEHPTDGARRSIERRVRRDRRVDRRLALRSGFGPANSERSTAAACSAHVAHHRTQELGLIGVVRSQQVDEARSRRLVAGRGVAAEHAAVLLGDVARCRLGLDRAAGEAGDRDQHARPARRGDRGRSSGSLVQLHRHQLDHESCAALAVEAILDPHPPPCIRTCSSTSASPRPAPSLPVRRPAPPPRANRSKIEVALLLGHAGPVVLDRDLDVRDRVVRRRRRSMIVISGSPPPYARALSMRLAITRASRRRSPRIRASSARSRHVDRRRREASSRRPPGGRTRRRAAPRGAGGSRRHRTGRSPAGPRRGPGTASRRSTAGRARPGPRSGISSRRASITSTEAASVISGERSSWLTSDAKRASRSTRCCSASAMSLNDSVRIAQIGIVGRFEAGVESTAGDRRGGLRGGRDRA